MQKRVILFLTFNVASSILLIHTVIIIIIIVSTIAHYGLCLCKHKHSQKKSKQREIGYARLVEEVTTERLSLLLLGITVACIAARQNDGKLRAIVLYIAGRNPNVFFSSVNSQ